MARLLAWIGIAFLVSYLVFVGGAGAGIHTANVRIVSLVLAGLGLATWVIAAIRSPEWRPRSVLLRAAVVAFGSLATATAFSRFPRVSIEYLAFAVVLAALYLLLVRLFANPFFRTRLLNLTSGLFLVISVGYIAAVALRWANWWAVLGHVAIPPLRPEFESLTFGNPSNVLMMVALLAVPTAARAPWDSVRGVMSVGAVSLLTAAVALLTGSRSGWLALAIAMVVGGAVLAITYGLRARQARRKDRLRSLRPRIRFAIVGGLLAFAAVSAVLAPAVIRRATEGGEELRLTFIAVALRLFAESPIVGTGPGTWVIQRMSYTNTTETDHYIPHAHDIYVQTLAEQGVIGGLAGLFVIVSLVILVARAISSKDRPRWQWGVATLAGLAYFGTHEALDLMVNLPSVLFALAIPIAYLDATAADTRQPAPDSEGPPARVERAPRLTWAVAACAMTLALGGLIGLEQPARASDAAVALANAGRWDLAQASATDAVRSDPSISAYLFTAGLVEAHAGNHEESARLFRDITRQEDLPEAWLNLAAEELLVGNRAAALQAARASLRLGRQRPAIAMAAGDLALRAGEESLARDAFVAAVDVTPSLLADPWWMQDQRRAVMLDTVAAAAMTAAPPDRRWEVALMAGDADTAAALAPDDARRDFVAAWTGDSTARGRLVEGCEAHPLDLERLLLCARAEGRAGNQSRANDLRYLANAQVGGVYSRGAELRVRTTPATGRSLEGSAAIFWGTYTYRRPTPWDVLVPSLIHLTLE